MKIIPLFDFVHIRKQKEDVTTAGGIILPQDKATIKYEGIVVAVGPNVKHIKKGNVIIYKQYTSNAIPNTEDEYLVSEKDVLAIR